MKKILYTLAAAVCLVLSGGAMAQSLSNPNSSKSTKGLKAYLDDVYGKQMISGQYWDTWATYVKTTTGKTPAILGLDFMDYTARRRQEGANPSDIAKAIDWVNNKKGIVTFSWHWDAPTDIYDASFRQECAGTTGGDARWYKAFYSCAVYFDVNDALNNPGSAKYNLLIRDMDVIANELKKLRDADVPVLFRPLHEASGGWFWWGAKGPGPCKKLWNLMYDRFTNYHQLNNLIWVWNCYGNEHGNPNDWFPGYDKVDIIAYDYPRGSSWSEYNTIHGGKGKNFALAEVAGIPDPNNFNNAKWNYFVTWSDFVKNNNSVDYLKRVYNDPKVVTLESLPDYKNFGYTPNLATGKPVTVSSTEAGLGNVAANVNDGSSATRWASLYADPQWVVVDLQARKNITKIEVLWEAASAKDYKIEVSSDGTTWTPVVTKTNMAAGPRTDSYTSLNVKGRYVRVHGTARNTTYGYSIYEIRVDGTDANPGPVAKAGADITVNDANNNGTETVTLNGSASELEAGTTATYSWKKNGVEIASGATASANFAVGTHTVTLTVTDNNGATSSDNVIVTVTPYQAPNLALRKPVTVSSTEATYGNIATNAVDGSATTRWSSVYADPQWIQVDLQGNYSISKVVLSWEVASAKDYRVETSLNGTSWAPLVSKTAMAAGARVDNLTGLSGTGRYIRIYGTSRNTTYGYSLYEIEVYGTPAIAGNIPPTANAGADITVTDADNNLSELVSLSASGSSDLDGTIASYSWSGAAGTFTSAIATPSFTLPVGTYTFTLTVTDNEGSSSTDQVVVTVKAKPSCTLLSLFGVPSSSSLPSISNKSFSRVHVLGNGPNLNNVSSAVIQWEAQYNGLWQFAFNTNNGVPQWYLNLIPLSTQNFNSASPSCKFTGTGISKLDGDYWVKMDGANFVMVSKTGSHALYFSNSNTAPTGCSGVRFATTDQYEDSELFVVSNSAASLNETVGINLEEGVSGKLSVINTQGRAVLTKEINGNAEFTVTPDFTPGLHVIQIEYAGKILTKKLLIY